MYTSVLWAHSVREVTVSRITAASACLQGKPALHHAAGRGMAGTADLLLLLDADVHATYKVIHTHTDDGST